MSKFKIINLIDKLFVSACVFLIIYAWINFYIRNLWTTFILSIIFSSAILFVIYYLLEKKQEKIGKTKKENEEFNKTILAFRLTPRKQKYELIEKILKKKYVTELKDNTLTYVENDIRHLVIIATHIEKLTGNDIINIVDEYMDYNINCIDIICNEFVGGKTNLLSNVKINIINKKKLYTDFFCESEFFPDTNIINSSVTKLSIQDIAKNLFLPQKSKAYFLCGLVLIFSSIILPYHYYYLIFGSVFLIFSLICKLIPKFSS